MQNIRAQILLDSVNPRGRRITTWELKYPRFIHAEFMTHRLFSKNAASSRAIPVRKLLDRIRHHPAVIEFWGKNQAGMQAFEEMSPEEKARCHDIWMKAADQAVYWAEEMSIAGAHKQIANRMAENFGHIVVIATGHDLCHRNFFGLRAHKAAEPHFQILAYTMLEQYLASKPRELEWGQWHTPYHERMDGLTYEEKVKISTARCARVSYLNHDGEIDFGKDFKMHDNLAGEGHWSPFEHNAKAEPEVQGWESNLGTGWLQYRKLFPAENRSHVDLAEILATKPDWIKSRA